MNDIVKLLVNDEVILEYNKAVSLPENQKEYMDNMDNMMAQGIELEGEKLSQPDLTQKAQFVALTMVKHLKQHDHNNAIAMFSYLVNRLPGLKQVITKFQDTNAIEEKTDAEEEKGEKVGVEFVFDHEHGEWQKVELQPIKH